MSRERPEIAFVVQRYGEGITGGSESLARAVAERLAGEYRITVFTSCARDYVTWRNELPEGLERLAGVDVRRFGVERERDLAAFNAFAEPLYGLEAVEHGQAGASEDEPGGERGRAPAAGQVRDSGQQEAGARPHGDGQDDARRGEPRAGGMLDQPAFGHAGGRAVQRADGQAGERTGRQADGPAYRQTGGQSGGGRAGQQAAGQADRQTADQAGSEAGQTGGEADGRHIGAGLRRRTRAEEHLFLRYQGPEVPRLVHALRAERDRFAAFVFFTYLYYPTYWGLAAVPERAALVPTTHDEPPLRFSIYDEVFARPRAFGFLTPAEEALVRRRFEIGGRRSVLVGMGVEAPSVADAQVAAFRARHRVERPYAIYAGRIDAGKGCAEMLAHHERYRRGARDALDLVLIGRLAMREPSQPGVRYLGFLDEAEKTAALAGARAVVCPSPFESLSIALLEALALGTPGLVNARSEVLKEHCLRSGAALYYEDGDQYAEALDTLARDSRLHAALAASGRRYVEVEYRWDVVLDRWRDLIRAAAGGTL